MVVIVRTGVRISIYCALVSSDCVIDLAVLFSLQSPRSPLTIKVISRNIGSRHVPGVITITTRHAPLGQQKLSLGFQAKLSMLLRETDFIFSVLQMLILLSPSPKAVSRVPTAQTKSVLFLLKNYSTPTMQVWRQLCAVHNIQQPPTFINMCDPNLLPLFFFLSTY